MRASDKFLKSVDTWRRKQEGVPSRAEAIRRLVEHALAAESTARPRIKKTARMASDLAAREIENLGDTSQPLEEQQRRKRRLIRGPSEFRDIRADQPKRKG
jgi:metal-responsive CopG/Arc/MetJ family transcriptional regulator